MADLASQELQTSIIEGPPGTGKTRLIGTIAVICLSENRKFRVVADTRYAVRIAAEAIFNAMIIARLQQRRDFVIKHVDTEGISSDIEESYTDEDEDEVGGPVWFPEQRCPESTFR